MRLVHLLGYALAASALALSTGPVLAQNFQAGPAPTFRIFHECVEEIPTPRDRYRIGIGEKVALAITGWSDIDYAVDAYGSKIEISDQVGAVTWSLSGPGEVNPTTGTRTYYTAPDDMRPIPR